MSKYPEHEKLKRCQVEASAISNFIDFMHERGWELAAFDGEVERLLPVQLRPDEIIGLFLGIDPKKLESEKRTMLDEIRRANTTHQAAS